MSLRMITSVPLRTTVGQPFTPRPSSEHLHCDCDELDVTSYGMCRGCFLPRLTVAIAVSGSPAAVPAGAGADPEAAFGVAVAKVDGPATAAPT